MSHIRSVTFSPFIKRIFDVYGPKRMLWGADRGRLTCTYRQCLNQVRLSLDFLSSEDREWILGKALANVLNWLEEPLAQPGRVVIAMRS
jgi:hypothetical protein